MLRVPLSKARCGMKLAMPVHHPALPGHVLLKPGFELDSAVIRRMQELKVPSMWIYYPALADVVRYISPEIADEHAQITRVLSESLLLATRDAHARLDFSVYAGAVRSLIRKLSEDSCRQLLIAEVSTSDRVLAAHGGNVCFLSLLMGLKLDAYLIAQRSKLHPQQARCVENLGVGALVHDIGVLRIPRDALERFSRTGDEADPQWRRHVELGVEAAQGRVEPSALAVIAQHHQRYDGQGFPVMDSAAGKRLLVGNEIHIFARIAHIADLFDRLRNGAASPLRDGPARPRSACSASWSSAAGGARSIPSSSRACSPRRRPSRPGPSSRSMTAGALSSRRSTPATPAGPACVTCAGAPTTSL